MAKLVWDAVGARHYETGVSKGVLFPWDSTLNSGAGGYGTGVAWNGLISVTESPSGAEASPLYADNIKYLNLISKEDFGATIEAYTYPDAFAACDGSAELSTGVLLGQQGRSLFALAYVTQLGNDTDGDTHGYKLHIIYGAKAAPSERSYATINESPEAITFSWELTTTPVAVTDHQPTAYVVLDSTKVAAVDMAAVEDSLFGTDGTPGTSPTLLLPDELLALIVATVG